MSEATKVRNYNADDQMNRDWLRVLPQIRQAMGIKAGSFVTIEGQPVFMGGPSAGGGGLPTAQLDRARKVEEAIKDQDYETVAIIDSDGNVLDLIDGEESQVDLFGVENLKDNLLTHNHPSSRSISGTDVAFAVKQDLQAVRAVGKDGTVYQITRPADGWPKGLIDNAEKVNFEVRQSFFDSIRQGTLTPREAEARHWDAVWEAVSAMTGVPYTKEQ